MSVMMNRYAYGQAVQGEVLVEIKLEGSLAADQPTINNAVKVIYLSCRDGQKSGLNLISSEILRKL